jgi:hypothetical protein
VTPILAKDVKTAPMASILTNDVKAVPMTPLMTNEYMPSYKAGPGS